MGQIYNSVTETKNSGGGNVEPIEEWNATKSYNAGDITRVGRSLYLAAQSNSNSKPFSARESLEHWSILQLNDPVTVTIPELFDNLTTATMYFSDVASSSTVSINITGAITDSNIMIDNSTIGRFIIIGGEIIVGESSGVTAIGAGVNVEIDGTKFTGAGATRGDGLWTNNSVAAFALDGARVVLNNVVTNGVYYGAQAARAVLSGEGCAFNGGGDTGVLAFDGGQISLHNCDSNNAYDADAELGWGYVAEAGASMWLRQCRSTGNVKGGMFANIGGHIRDDQGGHGGNVRGCVVNAGSNIEVSGSDLSSSESTNAEIWGGVLTGWSSAFDNSKQGNGIYANGGAVLHLHGCSTNNNLLNGVIADQLSVVKLYNSHSSLGNGDASFSPSLGVMGTDGALIID